jgi:hypothetical protein
MIGLRFGGVLLSAVSIGWALACLCYVSSGLVGVGVQILALPIHAYLIYLHARALRLELAP